MPKKWYYAIPIIVLYLLIIWYIASEFIKQIIHKIMCPLGDEAKIQEFENAMKELKID